MSCKFISHKQVILKSRDLKEDLVARGSNKGSIELFPVSLPVVNKTVLCVVSVS